MCIRDRDKALQDVLSSMDSFRDSVSDFGNYLFHFSVKDQNGRIIDQSTGCLLYTSASCHRRAEVTLTGDGLKCADLTELRIPTEETIALANGDRAIFGCCESAEPPAGAMTVTAFSDNRRGSAGVRHWKVVCTG